jgi:hypothetical protein
MTENRLSYKTGAYVMDYNFGKAVENARRLLLDNSEWVNRFDGYADLILKNEAFISSARGTFREWSPLRFYISVTQAKSASKTLRLDVRYMGQIVAALSKKDNGAFLSTKEYDENNFRDFGCNIKLYNAGWDGHETKRFRRYFRSLPDRSRTNNKGNVEHNVENMLLTEFSKRKSADKLLLGIQPVKIAGVRFGMPTPLSASDHEKLKYANVYGGGIDILARSGAKLTVIEVKDENTPKEPPQAALKQAIEYAVFIRELLRSKSGEKWYRLFGFSGKLPRSLTIRTACAMPDDIPEKSFTGKTLPIENDAIECHYLYFTISGEKIAAIDSSL